MAKTYYVGDVAKLTVTIKKDDVLIDPGSLKLQIKNRSAAAEYIFGIDAEIARDGPGAYHAMIPITQTGNWLYRWRSGGEGTSGAVEREFFAGTVF